MKIRDILREAGDVNGHSFISWPANELRQGVAEGIDPDTFEDLDARIIARAAKQIVPTARARRTPEGYVHVTTEDGLDLYIGASVADGVISVNIGSGGGVTTSGAHKGAVTEVIRSVYDAAVRKYGEPDTPGELTIDHDAGHGVWQHIADKLGLTYAAVEVKESGVTERKKSKKKSRWAAYGPGPFGGYGFAAGYSGDGGIGEDQDLTELNVAATLKFIKDAHGDQLYGKLPYWRHPRAVAMTGRRIFGSRFNSEAVKAAFLHDVVEDTDTKLSDLEDLGFSDRVVEAVALLTKDSSLTYFQNIDRIISSGNEIAQMVKYADNYENYTGDKSDWDPGRAASSNRKYLQSLNRLGDHLGVKHHIEETSYPGNLGAMETVKFYKVATPREKELLKMLIKDKKHRLAWQLIQRVTGTKLQGQEFTEDRTADVTFDTGEKRKVRYHPTNKDIVDTIIRYYMKQGLRVVKVDDEEIDWNDVTEDFADGKINYTKPRFDVEWEEAARYPEFVKIGKEAWIELARTGKEVTITSAKGINNTTAADPDSFKQLEKDKQARALSQIKQGSIEMPIIAVYSDGRKELLGGNTRLTAILAKYGKATVWAFKVPDEISGLTENFADGKVKGKSRPGRVKRAGASCKGSVSELKARAKKYSGERGKMYHWCANMKAGKNQ